MQSWASWPTYQLLLNPSALVWAEEKGIELKFQRFFLFCLNKE